MLPMMYMPDCLKATMDLMEAPFDKLEHHSNFNIAAISFTAGGAGARRSASTSRASQSATSPDFHQAIADTWPRSIDDSAARAEWGWKPAYDLAAMTADMLRLLKRAPRHWHAVSGGGAEGVAPG